MKKFISVLLLIVLFTVNTITIFAENATITANVENTGRSVTVTGNISTGAEKQISIYLTDANGNIAYVNQIESGANGDFAITFSLAETAIEGTYNLTVGGTNVETPARLSFVYTKSTEPEPEPETEPEEATITASVENTGRSVTVTGNISTGAEKQISIYLTDANGNIAYVNQIESGANGDFAITFSLAETAIEGTYNLTVGGTNVETPARLSFTYTKSTEPEPEEATITASVENTGRSVTVTGNISTGAEKQISIYLTDANGNIAYVNQIESGANGDFAITFSLAETAIEGTYNLTVGGTNVETPARLSFTYEKQRVQFVDADVNVTISGYVPSISGTVYCTEGKTITLSIINKTDDTTVANETITSETGVFDLSYTLPSLLNPKEYVVLVSCAENNSSLADMSVTIDSSILALEVSGTVSTAENVNVDAELQSVNTGLIDKSATFTGSKSVSVTIPNILSTASFHLVAKGYEAVEASEEEPIPDPDPEPEPEPGDDTNVNFENAAEIKPNAVVYEIITENSKNKYIADLKADTEYRIYVSNGLSYNIYINNNGTYEEITAENDILSVITPDKYYFAVDTGINTEKASYVFVIKELSDSYINSNVYITPVENEADLSGNWFFAYDTAVNSSESDTLFTVKSGDYLYYSNMYDSGKLYRKNINTGIEEKICEDSAAWIYVHDGYIYYKNISDGRKAYRLPVDSDYVITGEIAE